MKIILRNKLAIFLILLASLMSFGCMNDMEHQGNWASPVADEDYLYVPSDSGKILPSRITAVSQFKQRQLSTAIKRAKILGLI